jgi:UDP-N-acetylmuramoyl-tripeptide--D-alanyl-D-alanine ligase
MAINPFARDGWLRAGTRAWRRSLPDRAKLALAVLRARRNRRGHPATFIAVTGSSAKTTTVGLLGHVLEGHAPTTKRSVYNTLRDVAPAIAAVPRAHRFAVLETGASRSVL